MDAEIHTLVWPNVDNRITEGHVAVTRWLGLPVTYTFEQRPHGFWMDAIMERANTDVVGFFDADCVPTNNEVVEQSIEYAYKHNTFVGIAQASNHIGLKAHVFAAPAFFFISKQCWLDLGKPTFSETQDSDVAENVAYCAIIKGKRYKALYPTHWEREPLEGVWRLHNYGLYGIGTHFRGGVYHLYQGRFHTNAGLFSKRCREIIDGSFTTDNMFSSFMDYEGKIVP